MLGNRRNETFKNGGWKTTFLVGWPIFRGYVKLRGCMMIFRSFAEMFDHVCGPFGLFSTDCREKKDRKCCPSKIWKGRFRRRTLETAPQKKKIGKLP